MPLPSDLLQVIAHAVECVLQEGGLNPQQVTFVNHIQKTASELSNAIRPIPKTDHALRRIIPTLGDALLQQEAALFGYARLLLEQPQSFGGASLSTSQAMYMREIAQQGQALYQLTEQIIVSARSERAIQHHAAATLFELESFFEDEAPIWHYVVRDVPVQLSISYEAMTVRAAAYHLAALIQHIITVLSHELIEYGHIKVSSAQSSHETVIHIFCTGTQLNAAEMDSLFQKNGRYLYLQRLEKDGGSIRFLRENGRGTTLQLVIPE